MGSEKNPYRKLFIAGSLGAALCWAGSARAADYLLDPNYAGVNGAPGGGYAGVFNTIAAALGSSGVPSGASASTPNRLVILPGTYNTASVTGISLKYTNKNVDLIGASGNPNDVVITSTLDAAYNPGSGALGTTNSATLQLTGSNITASGITFANGTDTPYIVNTAHLAVTPQGTYTGNAQTATSQGVALLLQGDKDAFQNCNFVGYQDTLYTKGGRAYFTNCTVSGDIDFIFANGTDVFENSTINMDGNQPNGGTVTAASTDKRTSNGIVFLNSTLTANSVKGNAINDPLNAANVNGPAAGTQFLGRPWGWTQTGGDASTVFINTKMSPAINAAGWEKWDNTETSSPTLNGGNLAEDTRYAEYNSMDLSGNPLSITGRASFSHQLTAGQATAYTDAALFSFEGSPSFPWYGPGYPAGDASNPGTGSANPTDPNYSWPAYWGDRNTQNEGSVSIVTGNPVAYSDPSWTVAGNFDPNANFATLPEPGSMSLVIGGVAMLLNKRRKRPVE